MGDSSATVDRRLQKGRWRAQASEWSGGRWAARGQDRGDADREAESTHHRLRRYRRRVFLILPGPIWGMLLRHDCCELGGARGGGRRIRCEGPGAVDRVRVGETLALPAQSLVQIRCTLDESERMVDGDGLRRGGDGERVYFKRPNAFPSQPPRTRRWIESLPRRMQRAPGSGIASAGPVCVMRATRLESLQDRRDAVGMAAGRQCRHRGRQASKTREQCGDRTSRILSH